MSKEMFFFATRTDMLKNLEETEKIRKIKYIKCGAHSTRDYVNSIERFDNFGINTNGNHQNESYLEIDDSQIAIAREVKQSAGGVKYFIDQMENKTSIVFWPSGLYQSNYLICGHVATIWEDEKSRELYKLFSRNLTKGYKKQEDIMLAWKRWKWHQSLDL